RPCEHNSVGPDGAEWNPEGDAPPDAHLDHLELKAPAAGLNLPEVHGLEVHDSLVRFDVDSEHLGDVVRRLGELGVTSLLSHPPTLEELFLRHYGDELAKERERGTAEAASGGGG